MKLPALALLAVLAAPMADAQEIPVGTGTVSVRERLKLGKGCEPFKGGSDLTIVVLPDATFGLSSAAGVFRGVVSPVNEKGRAWNLVLDEPSLALYGLYLQAGADVLCTEPLAVSGGEIQTARLQLKRDQSQLSLKLKTTVLTETGHGKHRLAGKGSFEPGVLPLELGPGVGVIRISLPFVRGGATLQQISLD